MTTHLDPDLRRTALTFAARLDELAEDYVAREEAVRLIGLATLCREHILLIGPPGTAKTSLVEQFSRMMKARSFSYLLTRFTEPAELFGAIDVRSFQDHGVYRVNSAGMLPTAEFVFLDEIFHGSSAILNALLTLINERVFYNGSLREQAALVTLLAAANELPDDPLLQAFCDRFLFRCRLDYVADEAIEDVLTIGWAAEQNLIRNPDGPAHPVSATFDAAALRELQSAVASIDLAPVRVELAKILLQLRADAVLFSDRRAVKAQKAIAANALLAGRGEAELDDLAVLVHLWATPYDETAIRRTVEGFGINVGQVSRTARTIEEIRYDLGQVDTQIAHVRSREECREVIRHLGRLLAEVRSTHPEASDLLLALNDAQTRTVRTLRDRFVQEGGFDV